MTTNAAFAAVVEMPDDDTMEIFAIMFKNNDNYVMETMSDDKKTLSRG